MISVFALSFATALDANTLVIEEIEVNGDDLTIGEDGQVLTVEEDDGKLEVKVVLENQGDVAIKDIEVEAEISGFEYGDYDELEDTTHLFNIRPGAKKSVRLEFDLPRDLDSDEHWLRVRVLDRNSPAITQIVRLYIEPSRHRVDIADVALSPGNTVMAGRGLFASVLLRNDGVVDEDDVKVTVAIPELGVEATEYVDAVENDGQENYDYEDVAEMFLPIPANAAAGTYTLHVTAAYDNFKETVSRQYQVNVVANELFAPVDTNRLVLAAGPQAQSVAAGQTATYGIALANEGRNAQAYIVEVSADWAQTSVSETLVNLDAGRSKAVHVMVTPNAGVQGAQVATVTIKEGTQVLETISLTANVVGEQVESSNLSWRNGLEIALIVLVVLLVIIGLIIGFSRLRKDDEEEEQTYY